jgi:hypothetical protein
LTTLPREKPLYRENLAALNDFFPDKNLLKLCEVAKFCGRDPRTVKKRYNIQGGLIEKRVLASRMSDERR